MGQQRRGTGNLAESLTSLARAFNCDNRVLGILMYERNYSNARRQPPASANTSGGLLGDGGPPLRVCQVLNCPTLRPSSTPAQGHLASRVELSTDTWRPLSSSLKPAFTQEQMNEKEGEGRRPLLPALNGFSLQSSFGQ